MKKAPDFKVAKDVDEYLSRLPEEVRTALENLRQTIKATAPKAQEVISYQMPGYKLNGPLVFFGSFAGHCSLFVISKNILKLFAEELKPFKSAGTTIHFHPDKPIPVQLVQKIVHMRIQQNEGLKAVKNAAK